MIYYYYYEFMTNKYAYKRVPWSQTTIMVSRTQFIEQIIL